ncbi:hypothetical protein MK407_08425 [Streptococcus sanguinis]|jgi:hypothetical protein|uniref:Uncharacterized protein n=1 Tax=Streptococcus sanguinis TaxID=1305 RepID=A0A859ELZ8_STRSA|nr:hypothetical protein [Streptococcus sanguinis]EFX95074.1 hypothetical protein HMPREF9398_0170 [Streptococcus sanguinis VMC66]MCY7039239.1 hypothetical protein [Streptococcus sanguinis]QKQ43128.1 hypothetical protein FOC72_00760 [Streptococcus sanguinis]
MFNFNDWEEIVAEYVNTNVGNDDFVYGNFIDWDSFRREHGDEVLETLGIDFNANNISEKLDEVGVPSDYEYEEGNPDFPDSFRHWKP